MKLTFVLLAALLVFSQAVHAQSLPENETAIQSVSQSISGAPQFTLVNSTVGQCFSACTRALGECNKGCRNGDYACINRCTPSYASCLKCCK